ncbi:MAG: hypothetical protein H6741_00900 [Alphaproteobacteria bacterium]|nr:hypothetical protein [Alphaproteobacteria bacterium]
MPRPTLLLLPFALACKAPEAPDDIEDMIVYGFEHYSEDDPRFLSALGEKLIPWMDQHIDEIGEGYAVHDLTEESLSAAGLDVQVEDGIVGALTGVVFSVPPERLVEAYMHPHQEDIFTSYMEFERSSADDPGCFQDAACDRFTADDFARTDLGVLGIELASTYEASYRWVELEDGSMAVAHRNLGPEPVEFSVDFLAVHQQYSFSLAYARPDGQTYRAWAIWADGEVIGADLPETWQISQGVSAMHKAGGDIETWLTGEPSED